MANTKSKAPRKEIPTEGPAPETSPALWPLGILLLLVATFFTGALVLKQLGIVSSGLPGCGAESDCGKLADSIWGSIPGINWPVSYIGFAYFVGMLVAWIGTARNGIPNPLRWIARLGALASFGFIVVMISLDSFCLYCIIAHVANFLFWILLEMMPVPRGEPSFNAFMTLAFSFLTVSAIIAIGQIQKRESDINTGQQVQQELVDAVTQQRPKAKAPEPVADPIPKPDPATPVVASPPTVSDDPIFTGRYLYGSPDAPVEIVMFSDYQCPDCYKYENQVMDVVRARDDVSLSVKHFPFNSDCNPYIKTRKHGNACWAARAVEAVGILGGNEAFWKMHQWLFKNKGNFTNEQVTDFVRSIGIDTIDFSTLIQSPETEALVAADVEEAYGYGVLFTPMIFINGVEVKWYHIPQNLQSTINKVADAIEAGNTNSATRVPPTASEKLILDWKENRVRNISDSNHDLFKGPKDAEIEVVVWGEFTSRDYMKKLRDNLMPALEQYPNHSYSYRVFPMGPECNRKVSANITGFPYACMTARAIKAATMVARNDQAWDFYDWLIEYGPQVDEELLLIGAAQAGIDPVKFEEAMNNPAVENMVQQDVSEGIQMGFRGPPAIYINGRNIPRWSPELGENVLERILAEAAREQRETK